MSSFRTALRATIFTAVLIGGALTAATDESHAEVPPLAFSANLHCTGAPYYEITFFNQTASDTTLSMTLITSLQTTKKSALVPTHSVAKVTFDLTIDERIDKLVLRDADDVQLFTAFADTVITGTGTCFRPAFQLLEMETYSLTCNAGVTHASVSIKNNGDYPAELTATADAVFPDAPSYSAALQAGLIFPDTETLIATPGSTRVFNLDFKIVDQFQVAVRKGATDVFVDGPRAMATGEGCATGPEVIEPTTTSTTVAPTLPPTTEGAPDTTLVKTTAPAIEAWFARQHQEMARRRGG
ncbi:MAG: hypothetical protein ABMA25_23400, partial [Ilumatobacteraceae bacterium]